MWEVLSGVHIFTRAPLIHLCIFLKKNKIQDVKLSLHSTATRTFVLTLVTHLGLPNTDIHVDTRLYGCNTKRLHLQPTLTHRHPCSPPGPRTAFSTTVQYVGPCACTERSSYSTCRQNMLDIHSRNKSFPQDPSAVPATPGAHSTCALLYQPLRRFPTASGVNPAGCACFPVRALPWSRKAPAAETQRRLGIYCIWLFLVHHHQRGN